MLVINRFCRLGLVWFFLGGGVGGGVVFCEVWGGGGLGLGVMVVFNSYVKLPVQRRGTGGRGWKRGMKGGSMECGEDGKEGWNGGGGWKVRGCWVEGGGRGDVWTEVDEEVGGGWIVE